ncbi:MAG: ATP-binding cassette domain-containing protein [Parvibaculaceae bacterium]
MANSASLLVEGLSKRFGGVVATDNVSFALDPGSIQCIIGPNGAGKSTFFSLLAGIQKPDKGRIVFKDVDITRMLPAARVRQGLGLTFQTNRVFHDLSVRQNLQIAKAAAAESGNEVKDKRYRLALGRFGLAADDPAKARNIPHHQRQWLEIVMVLASGPDLLLLDEPTAGMSPQETSNTAQVLRELNRTGLTLIVVEHDMAFVRDIAQRVTVLHQGRIFADGALDEVTGRQDVRDIYLGRK